MNVWQTLTNYELLSTHLCIFSVKKAQTVFEEDGVIKHDLRGWNPLCSSSFPSGGHGTWALEIMFKRESSSESSFSSPPKGLKIHLIPSSKVHIHFIHFYPMFSSENIEKRPTLFGMKLTCLPGETKNEAPLECSNWFDQWYYYWSSISFGSSWANPTETRYPRFTGQRSRELGKSTGGKDVIKHTIYNT